MLQRVMRYALTLLMLSLVAVTPLFAGGSREADQEPQDGRSEPATAEGAPEDAGDSGSGDTEAGDAEADGKPC